MRGIATAIALLLSTACVTCKLPHKEESVDINPLFQRNVTIEVGSGSGSGVVLETNIILTCAHLFQDTVFVNSVPATILKRDTENDLMVLAVKTPDIARVEFAKGVRQDDEIMCVGNPLSHTGVISRGRVIDIKEGLIYTDAHIAPGFSGGGCYNLKGELLGIVMAVEMGSFGASYGVIVPIDKLGS